MQSDCSGKPEGRSRKNNDMRKFRDWACKGRQESTIGRGGCTGQHIPEPTALKTLKSNGSMTVSKRGNTEREKRRKPPQPHSKTKQPTAKELLINNYLQNIPSCAILSSNISNCIGGKNGYTC